MPMCVCLSVYMSTTFKPGAYNLLESIQKPDLANMCMVQKPEDRYKVVLQVNVKELSKLSQEQTLEALRASKESLVIQVLRCSSHMREDWGRKLLP